MYNIGNNVFADLRTKPFAKVLAIGDPKDWGGIFDSFPDARDMPYLNYQNITEKALNHYRPHSVYSPVFSDSYDCIDLAVLLEKLAFKGLYRAFGTDLPNPKLIEREVHQTCPRLNFQVVQA